MYTTTNMKRTSKNRNRNSKTIVMSGLEATVMPKYNAYACGNGIHKSKKHADRPQRKSETRREIRMYV